MTQREDFVRCAREQVGRPYKWATAGPRSFDCSGLVAYCYQQATGDQLTRSSYEQYRLAQPLTKMDAKVSGDLMFWDTENNGTAGHVGIFDRERFVVINALNPSRGVVESAPGAEMGGPLLGYGRLFPVDAPYPAPVEEKPRSKRPRRPRKVRRLVPRQEDR